MNYMTVKEASILWQKDVSSIGKLLRMGRIEGATKMGGHWVLPKDAQMPGDGRTRKARQATRQFPFRFPFYMNFQAEQFVPPLSPEEEALRSAQLDFLACDFEKAEKTLQKLADTKENIYIRLTALCFLSLLSAVWKSGKDFSLYHHRLCLELSKDFPRKKEMELLPSWLYYCLSLYQSASESIHFDREYAYPPSVTPLMLWLSFFDKSRLKATAFVEKLSDAADTYEIILHQLMQDGFLYEAQGIHAQLFFFYELSHNEEAMRYHLKQLLDIALEHRFFYFAADIYPYYSDFIDQLLKAYPEDFANKVRQCGLQIDQSFSLFLKEKQNVELYSALSSSDYRYIRYALEGASYKQLADSLKLSERTVANHYRVIYEKLGIAGKQELLKILKDSIKVKA